MLKRILFDIAPAISESEAVRNLLHALEVEQIEFILNTTHAPSSAYTMIPASVTTNFLTPPGDCLVITDSDAGIISAKNENLPCIGYAPPGSSQDMSGTFVLFEDFTSIDVIYLQRTHAHLIGCPAEILTTERLIVREFSEEDFPTLYAMCTEPSTASFMEETISDYKTEQEKHTAYLHNVYPFFDLALWGIFEKDSGKLIGRAGFSLPKDHSDAFSLGYLIDVPYRRQGYAKELIPALLSYAKEQGYTEISARIKKGNVASVKVLEKCGFPYECTENSTEGIITYLIHLTM